MSTREIPRDEWPGFFETFARLNRGRRVTIEEIGDEMGDQTEASGMPLAEITCEAEPDGRRVVVAIFGGSDEPSPLTRMIDNPKRVSMREDDGAGAALEIEEQDGARLILVVENASVPALTGR